MERPPLTDFEAEFYPVMLKIVRRLAAGESPEAIARFAAAAISDQLREVAERERAAEERLN